MEETIDKTPARAKTKKQSVNKVESQKTVVEEIKPEVQPEVEPVIVKKFKVYRIRKGYMMVTDEAGTITFIPMPKDSEKYKVGDDIVIN